MANVNNSVNEGLHFSYDYRFSRKDVFFLSIIFQVTMIPIIEHPGVCTNNNTYVLYEKRLKS